MSYWPTFYTQYQKQCLTLSTILIQSFFKHLAHFFIIKYCLKMMIPICFFTGNIWRLICLIVYDYYVAELNKNNKLAATLGGAGSMPARSPSYYSSARTRSRGRNRSPYTPYSRSRSRGRLSDKCEKYSRNAVFKWNTQLKSYMHSLTWYAQELRTFALCNITVD